MLNVHLKKKKEKQTDNQRLSMQMFHSIVSPLFQGTMFCFAPYGLTGHDQECYLCSESQHAD